jgi:hypothetical protein
MILAKSPGHGAKPWRSEGSLNPEQNSVCLVGFAVGNGVGGMGLLVGFAVGDTVGLLVGFAVGGDDGLVLDVGLLDRLGLNVIEGETDGKSVEQRLFLFE